MVASISVANKVINNTFNNLSMFYKVMVISFAKKFVAIDTYIKHQNSIIAIALS